MSRTGLECFVRRIQTDRLSAIHIMTNRSKNVFGCINAYTLIKRSQDLKMIDFIFQDKSLN